MEKYHVLVVEDDKEIRDGIEIYLKSQGYEVFKAADGIEGLEIIYREEIHLAIVDVMMPRKKTESRWSWRCVKTMIFR